MSSVTPCFLLVTRFSFAVTAVVACSFAKEASSGSAWLKNTSAEVAGQSGSKWCDFVRLHPPKFWGTPGYLRSRAMQVI